MIPDADKLKRYDDLATLVEELHDENMKLRALFREASGTMSKGMWSSDFRARANAVLNKRAKKK